MEDLRVRIERILTSASLRWSQQANTGAWLSNKRCFRKENLLRIVVVTNFVALRNVWKRVPQFNEEDVDSPHGTEQQRLDCDWEAKEDCHLQCCML